MIDQFFAEELVRRAIVAPDPRPRDLGAYRIFTNADQDVFLAARLSEGRITVLAESDDFSVAMAEVLKDAGMPVTVAFREMTHRGPSYQPKVSDWS